MSVYIETSIIGECDYCSDSKSFIEDEVCGTSYQAFMELAEDWVDYNGNLFCSEECKDKFIAK